LLKRPIKLTAPGVAEVEALTPLPPFSPLRATSDENAPPKQKKFWRLSWATLLAAAGSLVVGMPQGMGAKIFDMLWPLACSVKC